MQMQSGRLRATGCHFTGPLALRRRISPALPDIELDKQLINKSQTIYS